MVESGDDSSACDLITNQRHILCEALSRIRSNGWMLKGGMSESNMRENF